MNVLNLRKHDNNRVGDNPMSEYDLDSTVEDSFPASDPPSHTPTTGFGGPGRLEADVPSKRSWQRSRATIGAAGVVLVALVAGFALARRGHA